MQTASELEGAMSLVTTVASNIKKYNDYTQNKSLIDVTKTARVEPLLLLDMDCLNLDYTKDVVFSLQSIFAGYYLQAIHLLGTSVDGVKVKEFLDPLNPNRNPNILNSFESYKHKLPNYTNHVIANEDKKLSYSKEDARDISDQLIQHNTLSVGKLYNVNIGTGDTKVTVPIAIRLLVNTIPSNLLKDLFTNKNSFDYSLKERWHGVRSGRLSFIKDFIFCNDLIDKHRKNLLKDKSGVYEIIRNREASVKLSGLIDKKPSLVSASNIAVISTETASTIEYELGGKLKDTKTRKIMFDNTNLMILAVVDKSFERVTYYYRGIAESSNVSIREIKTGNKDDNALEYMKTFLQGSAAAL